MADEAPGVVVQIRSGVTIAAPGQPDPAVVEELEELLAKAKAGEISGIAWSASLTGNTSSNHFVGVISRGQVGGLFSVMTRIARTLDG